jgi:hypothetical protein
MQSADLALWMLAAVLVGALLPVLVQAWLTLRSARRWLDHNGVAVGEALRELGETSRAYTQVARDLEGTLLQVRAPLATLSALSGAAVPALIAGLQALRRGPAGGGGEERRGDPAAAGTGGQTARQEDHHE